MSFIFKPLSALMLAGLLATMGLAATAQPVFTPTPAATASNAAEPHAHRGHWGGRFDPAKMQARRAKRQAELKAKLQLTANQESAWTTYTAAIQPPVRATQTADANARAEFDKLTTPERIDKRRAMRFQRMAQMSIYLDKRDAATKAFYAALTPEQQKTFDAKSSRRGHGHKHGRHHRFG